MAPRHHVSHYGTKRGASSRFQIYSRSLTQEIVGRGTCNRFGTAGILLKMCVILYLYLHGWVDTRLSDIIRDEKLYI